MAEEKIITSTTCNPHHNLSNPTSLTMEELDLIISNVSVTNPICKCQSFKAKLFNILNESDVEQYNTSISDFCTLLYHIIHGKQTSGIIYNTNCTNNADCKNDINQVLHNLLTASIKKQDFIICARILYSFNMDFKLKHSIIKFNDDKSTFTFMNVNSLYINLYIACKKKILGAIYILTNYGKVNCLCGHSFKKHMPNYTDESYIQFIQKLKDIFDGYSLVIE